MCNNPKLDLVNINAYIKFGEKMSVTSEDIDIKILLKLSLCLPLRYLWVNDYKGNRDFWA